jgi:hypothetical protein
MAVATIGAKAAMVKTMTKVVLSLAQPDSRYANLEDGEKWVDMYLYIARENEPEKKDGNNAEQGHPTPPRPLEFKEVGVMAQCHAK